MCVYIDVHRIYLHAKAILTAVAVTLVTTRVSAHTHVVRAARGGGEVAAEKAPRGADEDAGGTQAADADASDMSWGADAAA